MKRLILKKGLFTATLLLLLFFPLSADATVQVPLEFMNDVRDTIERTSGLTLDHIAFTMTTYGEDRTFVYDIFQIEDFAPVEGDRDDYLLTLPFIQDYTVIISRNAEDGKLEEFSDLSGKKYIQVDGHFTFLELLPVKEAAAGQTELNYSPLNVFSKIYRGEADYTLLPSITADRLLTETGMKGQLHSSGSADDTIARIGYRFAVRKDEIEKLVQINAAIEKAMESTFMTDIFARYPQFTNNASVSKGMDITEAKATNIMNIIVFLAIVAILSDIFFLKMKFNREKKEMEETPRKKEKTEAKIREQLEAYLDRKVSYTERFIMDPYSGLFSIDYFTDVVEKRIMDWNNKEQFFSVAVFRFSNPECISRQMVKTAADIIKEDFNNECVSSYNPAGFFLVLFPRRKAEDVQIFTEGAEDHLSKVTGCSFTSQVLEYGTVSPAEFMEKICGK